jgi:translation elongation factor EF-1beta
VNSHTRKQLTLFVSSEDAIEIENIRRTFNPIQFGLIESHVTLCREDEIENLEAVMHNLEHIDSGRITINFGEVSRFSDGKGVLIPASGNNEEFHRLRAKVLLHLSPIRFHEPHITLMHPRNSTCTDDIFESIKKVNLPVTLSFDKISLIEQANGNPWEILKSFRLKDI